MKIPFALLFSLSSVLPAQDPAVFSLRKTDGDVVNAQLIECTGDKVKLKVSVLGGSMTVTNSLSDFVPASVFKIEMVANPPENFDQHFEMAKKAAELRLLPQAGAEARAALKSAADAADFEQKRGAVRAWAADALETAIEQAVAADDLEQARHALELLTTRLADQRTEEQLDAIAASVEGLAEARKAAKEEVRQARLNAKAKEQIERHLGPIRKDVDKGDKLLGQAIRKSRSTVASARLCEQSIEEYKKGYRALKELVGKNPEDADLSRVAASLGSHMHDQAIRAALHAANMLCVQSDYKGAMDWTGKVLAFDPSNAEAKEMQRTIQLASAASSGDWDWRWQKVGGPPRPDGPENY